MSRYNILTDDENLEAFFGFDEGLEGFFLTICDTRRCSGDEDGYLFHNQDHHESVRMTLDEVIATMGWFGMILPKELVERLAADAHRCGNDAVLESVRSTARNSMPVGKNSVPVMLRRIVRWDGV